MERGEGFKIGRLAMRQEGANWNAYYAEPGTMEGAMLLGSVRMSLVLRPDAKARFLECMMEFVADIIQDATGQRPTFPDGPELAPPHERAGHG
jgi:hypothetical protein